MGVWRVEKSQVEYYYAETRKIVGNTLQRPMQDDKVVKLAVLGFRWFNHAYQINYKMVPDLGDAE